MTKRPCIRGLKEFQKTGCPEKAWVPGGNGCPAWREYSFKDPGSMKNIIMRNCVDLLSEYWQFEALKLLEGNQVAIEKFRNNMSTPDGQPKPDPAIVQLVGMVNQHKIGR